MIFTRRLKMKEPIIGIIGGTGLGDALAEQMTAVVKKKVGTPFGLPSDDILLGRFGSRKVAFISRHGRGHKLPPSQVPYAANIFALKKIGVHSIISSGAVGSLREEIKPGGLVLVDQFIDKTYKRTNTFFGGFGAVHCEMTEPVCGRLRERLIEISETIDCRVHPKGTYVCMEGPQFSTRSESLMHKSWKADLIGMTAMPEAKLAREAQMCYALIAIVSDYDCWQKRREKNKKTLLLEIIKNLQKATENCLELIREALRSEGRLAEEKCNCRRSLELAVWTRQEAISSKEKNKLKVLFE
jgi:5'-methylthioadenosine phosphorylase